MQYRYACVVDEKGYYKTFVLIQDVDEIRYYTLEKGEKIVETNAPNGAFIKAHWDGNTWKEGATQEEIAGALPPVEDIPQLQPTIEQRTAALESAMLAIMSESSKGVTANV